MDLRRMIDHTLLKPEATAADIRALCEEAKERNFKAVCIPPRFVPLAKEQLQKTDTVVCTVIGFPLGYNTTAQKAAEAREAVEAGADEVDMVLAVGALKEGDTAYVEEDIRAVRAASEGRILKVILETCLLTKEEIVKACEICKALGVAFVKTSTGFNKGGATVEDVALMKKTVGNIGVKASGGIRDTQTALAMIEAGATRIGASAGIAIVTGVSGNTSSNY